MSNLAKRLGKCDARAQDALEFMQAAKVLNELSFKADELKSGDIVEIVKNRRKLAGKEQELRIRLQQEADDINKKLEEKSSGVKQTKNSLSQRLTCSSDFNK